MYFKYEINCTIFRTVLYNILACKLQIPKTVHLHMVTGMVLIPNWQLPTILCTNTPQVVLNVVARLFPFYFRFFNKACHIVLDSCLFLHHPDKVHFIVTLRFTPVDCRATIPIKVPCSCADWHLFVAVFFFLGTLECVILSIKPISSLPAKGRWWRA